MATVSFEQFAERYDIHADGRFTGRTKAADWVRDSWFVTLKRAGTDQTFTLPFHMGTAHEGRAPTIETVLYCLSSDARSVEDHDDFEDWAREYGYNEDSRKAEAIYNDCVEQTERLKKWLGATSFAELLECEEDGDDPEPEDLHKRFDEEILPLVKEEYEQDGIADIPARSEAFNDWIDSLNKDGEISDWLASNITHPASCER